MRAVGRVTRIDVKGDIVVAKVRFEPDQLGKCLKMLTFTGKGSPRPMVTRFIRQDGGGISVTATMKRMSIGHQGEARVEVATPERVDVSALREMMDELVVIEYREVEE